MNYNKRDRSPVNNYGYTFKSLWSYKPDLTSPMKTMEVTSFSPYLQNKIVLCKQTYKDFEKIKRSGIIFIKKADSTDDVKFLVVRGKTSGIWSFPKGKIDDNENDEECAKREVFEETGLVISDLTGLPKCKMGRNTYFIMIVDNENDYSSFNIKDNYEVDLVDWKTFKELKELQCNKDIRAITSYPEKKYHYHTLIF